MEQALGVRPLYTGRSLFDWVVEVESEAVVRALTPDLGLLATVDARGVIVTARAEGGDYDFVSRFFAPGSLVSNLDFVENIFGNAGDPFLPENDAGLDVDHWTGHTGCVILAKLLGAEVIACTSSPEKMQTPSHRNMETSRLSSSPLSAIWTQSAGVPVT